MKFTTIKEIEQLEALEIDTSFNETIKILLAAINDWPDEVDTLEEFDLKVKHFIGSEVTKNKIMKARKNIDLSKDAWKAEALSQLMDIFKYYAKGHTLSEIIAILKQRYKLL